MATAKPIGTSTIPIQARRRSRLAGPGTDACGRFPFLRGASIVDPSTPGCRVGGGSVGARRTGRGRGPCRILQLDVDDTRGGIAAVVVAVLLGGQPACRPCADLDVPLQSPEQSRLRNELNVYMTLSGCSWGVVLSPGTSVYSSTRTRSFSNTTL